MTKFLLPLILLLCPAIALSRSSPGLQVSSTYVTTSCLSQKPSLLVPQGDLIDVRFSPPSVTTDTAKNNEIIWKLNSETLLISNGRKNSDVTLTHPSAMLVAYDNTGLTTQPLVRASLIGKNSDWTDELKISPSSTFTLSFKTDGKLPNQFFIYLFDILHPSSCCVVFVERRMQVN